MRFGDLRGVYECYMYRSEQSKRYFCPFPFARSKLILVILYLVLGNHIGWALGSLNPNLRVYSIVAVDEARNMILGFGYLRLKGSASVSNLGILVDDEHHGRGLGTELMEALVNLANVEEIETIRLRVMAENEAAVNLYKKIGFKQVDRQQVVNNYDGSTVTMYQMELSF